MRPAALLAALLLAMPAQARVLSQLGAVGFPVGDGTGVSQSSADGRYLNDDTDDTTSGRLTVTGVAPNSTNTSGTLVLNPASCTAGRPLFSGLANSVNKFLVDCDGNATVAGTLGVTGIVTLAGATPEFSLTSGSLEFDLGSRRYRFNAVNSTLVFENTSGTAQDATIIANSLFLNTVTQTSLGNVNHYMRYANKVATSFASTTGNVLTPTSNYHTCGCTSGSTCQFTVTETSMNDGQQLIIHGATAQQCIAVDTAGALELNASANFTIDAGDSLTLTYDSNRSAWVEDARSNNN